MGASVSPQPIANQLGFGEASHLNIGLKLVLKGHDWESHSLALQPDEMILNAHGVFPQARIEPLLHVTDDLDRDVLDLDRTHVRPNAPGGREGDRPNDGFGEATLDLKCSGLIRLQIDVVDSDIDSMQGQAQAAGDRPDGPAVRKARDDLAQHRKESSLDHPTSLREADGAN